MISWLEKRGSVILIVICALVVLFSALYTRQDDLKRAAAKNAAADKSDTLKNVPLFCAPVASVPVQAYRGVFKSESGLWQLDPYVRYTVKKGDQILSPCGGIIASADKQHVVIRAEDDLVFALTGSFDLFPQSGSTVAAGTEIAVCASSGVLLFSLTKDGNPLDPLSYLTPREVF